MFRLTASPWSILVKEMDNAFEWMERARREHDFWMAFIKVDPRLIAYHSEPRFKDLLESMKLSAN